MADQPKGGTAPPTSHLPRPGRGLTLMMVLLVAAACSAPESTSTAALDTPLTASIDSLYTVGRAEGESAEVFSRVADVAFDDEGHLLVMDEGNHRVQIFGDGGELLASVGREGDGPGEFRQAVDVAGLGGGLGVLDIGRSLVYAFSTDGDLRAEWRAPEGAGRVELGSPDGIHLVLAEDGDRFEEPDSISVHLYRTEPPTVASVAFRIPNPRSVPEVGPITRTSEGGFSMTRRSRASFLPEVHLAAGGDRIAVVYGTGYLVELRDAEGRIQERLERTIEPRPVTEELRRAERDRLHEALLERQAEGGAGSFAVRSMTAEEIEAYAESMIFPDTVPVILDLLAGPEGSVWVLRSDPDSPGRPGPIDLFDPRGNYVGTLRDLPFPDALAAEGVAAWVTVDALGIERVRVGRVNPSR